MPGTSLERPPGRTGKRDCTIGAGASHVIRPARKSPGLHRPVIRDGRSARVEGMSRVRVRRKAGAGGQGGCVPGELGEIGSRLREERERVRISQRELARRLGVSASLISQIESGQSKPSVSTLYAIVTELGVSLDDIFGAGNGTAAHPGDPDPSDPG